jgi:catechol 2,3-dioxygenase-like lactoylglutathione lyase family enzyme
MISQIRFTTLSVADLERAVALFRDVMGMSIIAQQEILGPEIEELWGLPTFMLGQSVILGKPDLSGSQIRLVQFEPVSQIVVREKAEPWDTGAIKIVDFMVSDFQQAEQALMSHGWEWRTPPQQYKLPNGEGESLEGHVKGPDGTIVGVIKLIGLSRSKYVEIADDVLFSEMATTSYLVPNITQALEFYSAVLGLHVTDDVTINEAEIQKLIGIPSGVGLRMVLLASGQARSGKIGLLEYEGVTGTSLAEISKPPHRGAVLISFETDNLDDLHGRLKTSGAHIVCPPVQIEVQPYGDVRAMTAKAPDGVMLEFFQRQ